MENNSQDANVFSLKVLISLLKELQEALPDIDVLKEFDSWEQEESDNKD